MKRPDAYISLISCMAIDYSSAESAAMREVLRWVDHLERKVEKYSMKRPDKSIDAAKKYNIIDVAASMKWLEYLEEKIAEENGQIENVKREYKNQFGESVVIECKYTPPKKVYMVDLEKKKWISCDDYEASAIFYEMRNTALKGMDNENNHWMERREYQCVVDFLHRRLYTLCEGENK